MNPVEILMFSGPSCHACVAMKPIMENIPNSRVVDVTEDHALAAQYGVRGGLPVFVKLVNGVYDSRLNGAMPQSKLVNWAGQR